MTTKPVRVRDYEVPADAIWTKLLPGESALWYAYFQRFLGLPDTERSYVNAAKALHLSTGHVTNIGARFKWVQRLSAFQAWIATCESRETIRLGEKTRAAEARVAEKAFRFLEGQLDLYLTGKGSEAVMPFATITQSIEGLGRFSRVGRGEPSEHRVSERKESMDTLMEKIKSYSREQRTREPAAIEVKVQNPPGQPHDPRNLTTL